MDIEILDQSKHKLIVDFKNEDRTIVDLLRKELWNDEQIKATGLHQPHPLVSTPRLIVETKGSPKEALQESCDRLQKAANKLQKEIEKAF